MVEATSSGYKTRNERKAQALRELMRKEVRSAKTAAAAAKADSKCYIDLKTQPLIDLKSQNVMTTP